MSELTEGTLAWWEKDIEDNRMFLYPHWDELRERFLALANEVRRLRAENEALRKVKPILPTQLSERIIIDVVTYVV